MAHTRSLSGDTAVVGSSAKGGWGMPGGNGPDLTVRIGVIPVFVDKGAIMEMPYY
jgi:hypothetical protein